MFSFFALPCFCSLRVCIVIFHVVLEFIRRIGYLITEFYFLSIFFFLLSGAERCNQAGLQMFMHKMRKSRKRMQIILYNCLYRKVCIFCVVIDQVKNEFNYKFSYGHKIWSMHSFKKVNEKINQIELKMAMQMRPPQKSFGICMMLVDNNIYR